MVLCNIYMKRFWWTYCQFWYFPCIVILVYVFNCILNSSCNKMNMHTLQVVSMLYSLSACCQTLKGMMVFLHPLRVLFILECTIVQNIFITVMFTTHRTHYREAEIVIYHMLLKLNLTKEVIFCSHEKDLFLLPFSQFKR